MRTEFKTEMYPELSVIKAEIESLLNVKDLSDKCRTRDFVMARWLYIKLAKEFTPYSTMAIGSAINRDHSTVVHAIHNMEFDFKYDKTLQAKHEELTIILTNKLHSNAIEDIDSRIANLHMYIEKLVKRKKQLISYAITYPEQQNQENFQLFWS